MWFYFVFNPHSAFRIPQSARPAPAEHSLTSLRIWHKKQCAQAGSESNSNFARGILKHIIRGAALCQIKRKMGD